jgi:hypothetical protein
MVMVAVIAVMIAYIARYYRCNTIGREHAREYLLSIGEKPFARSDMENEKVEYHLLNMLEYERAMVYPWMRVPLRFVPFDEYRRSKTAP